VSARTAESLAFVEPPSRSAIVFRQVGALLGIFSSVAVSFQSSFFAEPSSSAVPLCAYRLVNLAIHPSLFPSRLPGPLFLCRVLIPVRLKVFTCCLGRSSLSPYAFPLEVNFILERSPPSFVSSPFFLCSVFLLSPSLSKSGRGQGRLLFSLFEVKDHNPPLVGGLRRFTSLSPPTIVLTPLPTVAYERRFRPQPFFGLESFLRHEFRFKASLFFTVI